MYRTAVLLTGLLLIASSVSAQEISTPKQVTVSHTGDDRVGQILAYHLREELQSSAQMKLIDGNTARQYVQVDLITIDPFKGSSEEGRYTTYSCSWSYRIGVTGGGQIKLFLTSVIGTGGPRNAEVKASGLAATTNDQRKVVPAKLLDLALFVQEKNMEMEADQ